MDGEYYKDSYQKCNNTTNPDLCRIGKWTGFSSQIINSIAGVAYGINANIAFNNASSLKNGKYALSQHPNTGISFNYKGYPNFKNYLYKGINDVKIRPTGSRAGDVRAANKAAGYNSTPEGYVWHHHQDYGRMQLVNKNIHQSTGHNGGYSIWGN